MGFLQDYRRRLDNQRNIVRTTNEGALSHAFGTLLEATGEEYKLIFSPQYPFKAKDGYASLRADGVLMDRLALVHGWWEAKDSKDDLDKEIAAKIAKGYPLDNIIFEDTIIAVLYQRGSEVLRIPLADDAQIERLLTLFFRYVTPEVENFREAKAKFLIALPGVASALAALLAEAYQNNAVFLASASAFLTMCQRAIGPRVSAQHVDEMLIQHILTEETFSAVFPNIAFHRHNRIAQELSALERALLQGETRDSLLSGLQPYFGAITRAAAHAVTPADKQSFLKEVYEDFYAAYNPKDADKLGMVYTPNEAVRFIIEGCDWLTKEHFGKGLSDTGVDILDPCTGTGSFIVDLIDFLRGGDKAALGRKFASEVFANEISILPYYIACLNIEQALYDATDSWQEFTGACFVNTLDLHGFGKQHQAAQGEMFGGLTHENFKRIADQNTRTISVIIGNPPYNANQKNENDNNKNDASPRVDARIKETYVKASNAQKTKMYDPYIRFFRWASDRLADEGVIGFVTNRSYIDSRQADGFRKMVAQEFQEVWIVDLTGNARQMDGGKGAQGGNIFGIMTGVAIVLMVKNPKKTGCDIRYIAVPAYPDGKEKLRWLAATNFRRLHKEDAFSKVTPSIRSEWINQPEHDWSEWLPVASKAGKAGRTEEVIFKLYSAGIVTARDQWVYGVTANEVSQKMRYFIKHYELSEAGEHASDGGIKWSRNLKRRVASGRTEKYSHEVICKSAYRPFSAMYLYRSSLFIDERGSVDVIFPQGKDNFAIYFTDTSGRSQFSTIVTNTIGDFHLCSSSDGFQSLPLWIYSPDGTRQDNITDWALQQFRAHYADDTLEKRDIFDYVYAVLHHPAYREKYALNLKAEFPRIPFYADFRQWAAWGRQLIDLHTGYARLDGTPLQRVDAHARKPHQNDLGGLDTSGKQEIFGLAEQAPKCKLKADKVNGSIEIDAVTRLEGIPPEAWQYRLGNRSALEWVLDQYRDFTPKDPTLREKFNLYRFAEHKEAVIVLLGQVCQVSIETLKIIKALPMHA